MIAHFRVIKNPLAGLDVVVFDGGGGMRREVFHVATSQHLKGLAHHGHVILGQRTRIGTWVGQGFVALIEALGDAEGGFGAETELAVGLTLQRGQIEQQRAGLRRRLAFFSNSCFFATHSVGYCLRFALRPYAVGFDFSVIGVFFVRRVEPFARVFTRLSGKRAVDFPIVTADELADFLFALDHNRQGWCLYTPNCGQKEATIAGVERRHGACAVDTDQPIGLGAAAGGIGQRQHLFVGAQVRKAVANRLWCHGLQPQARYRVLGFAVLLDQAEDQFTLAPCVTGVDKCAHVFAFRELDDGVEPRFGLVHRLQVKVRRYDW